MKDDPIVAEVRRVREELARKFQFDADAIFADIQSKQNLLGDRIVRRTKKDAEKQAVEADKSASLHGGR